MSSQSVFHAFVGALNEPAQISYGSDDGVEITLRVGGESLVIYGLIENERPVITIEREWQGGGEDVAEFTPGGPTEEDTWRSVATLRIGDIWVQHDINRLAKWHRVRLLGVGKTEEYKTARKRAAKIKFALFVQRALDFCNE